MSNDTIKDIFTIYGDEYIKKHNLSKEQWKVFNSIRNCGTKTQVIIYVPVKTAVKNILDIILVVIDTVLCVKTIKEKNGLTMNLVIYLILNIFILLLLFPMN